MYTLYFLGIFGVFITSCAFTSETYTPTEHPKKPLPPDTLEEPTYRKGQGSDFRHTLADAGVTIDLSYVTNLLSNPIGGKKRACAYTGSLGAAIHIDFHQLGWTHLHLLNSYCWRTGTNLSRCIDNQFTVSQIFGSETFKLNELYLLLNPLESSLILKAGRLNAGQDFLSSPLYWHYVNNAFDGNPVSIFYNIPFCAYPNATWGAFMEMRPWKQFSFKSAVYNADQAIQQNQYHGMNFSFSGKVVGIAEGCFHLNQDKEAQGLPGHYKAGIFYFTGAVNLFSGGTQQGDPGCYLLFDQIVYKPPPGPQRLTSFLCLLLQPKNRNLMPFFASGGCVYQGPFSSRPHDSASLGLIYGRYSSDLRVAQKKQQRPSQQAETVIELNYVFQIKRGFSIAPDMQYIIHPRGLDTPNAWVIGAQIELIPY